MLNSRIILVIIFLIAILILLVFLITQFGNNNQTNTQMPPENLVVTNIQPTSILLEPGQIQKFAFTFNQSISLNQLFIELKRSDPISDNPAVIINVDSSLSEDGKELTMATKEPLLPFHVYSLKIAGSNGRILFQKEYTSDYEKPKKVEQNNLELVQFLPYQTDSFALSYISSQNRYIFNFFVDYNKTDPTDVQYEKAKQEALDFIRSKGIDPNSLVIEWKHH